jgi:hypothetical protein
VEYCTSQQPQHREACLDLLRSTDMARDASDMLAQCVWRARHQEQWCLIPSYLGELMSLLVEACTNSDEDDDDRRCFLYDPRLIPAALEAMRMHPWDWVVQRAGAEICSTRHFLDYQVSALWRLALPAAANLVGGLGTAVCQKHSHQQRTDGQGAGKDGMPIIFTWCTRRPESLADGH